VGPSGSFFIDVDGKTVLRKDSLGFPTEKDVVNAVSKALGR
jgi:hypothetical protein